MIIQTARAGDGRLAVMMHEHTALSGQFARAFGNDQFEPAQPAELVTYVVSHHDAGWAAFDRDPVTDEATGLPYNLIETPAQHITRTSALSPAFNERHHPYCGLLSSMHSWGLYNGRYGISSMVLIDRIPPQDRPLADTMLDAELARQQRLKAEIANDPDAAAWLDERHVFQNYKQLQFFDTLALYFNRTHREARTEQTFTHVPRNADQAAGAGCLRGRAVSVGRREQRIRLRRAGHRAAPERVGWLAGGAEACADRLGDIPSRGWLGRRWSREGLPKRP